MLDWDSVRDEGVLASEDAFIEDLQSLTVGRRWRDACERGELVTVEFPGRTFRGYVLDVKNDWAFLGISTGGDPYVHVHTSSDVCLVHERFGEPPDVAYTRWLNDHGFDTHQRDAAVYECSSFRACLTDLAMMGMRVEVEAIGRTLEGKICAVGNDVVLLENRDVPLPAIAYARPLCDRWAS